MQKIIESNKLVAEFMGLTQGKPNETRWRHDWFDEAGAVTGRRETHLLFHSDWNWLMKVIQKLDAEEQGHPEETGESYYMDKVTIELLSLNIDTTFEAVVDWIKWYNENK